MKVFLGGTCNGSDWREKIINNLDCVNIEFFNPVVSDWTPEHQANEIKERESADVLLYVITPKMRGVYSIAEAVQDSNKRPENTIFCVLEKEEDEEGEIIFFKQDQLKSLHAVGKLIHNNGATFFDSLSKVIHSLFVRAKVQVRDRKLRQIQSAINN